MPLSMATPGIYRVKAINGGRTMLKRLTDMGLRIGSILQVVSINPFGPVIVQVNNTRLALGKSVAHRIIVEGAE
ncbi:FeoA family protein [Kosmotoga sp. DU53]|uniref:FeoA family protein n=1 Tax=Kosmotoga sp. DU53 TaxID=1310160 RepID=UPI0007C45EFC|nr:FeoA family protein [Kosmotoga sp. DU53]OAA21227.1 hypothetical protein DU53_06405 [Kosmotoga sp. DU53]